LDRRRRRLLAAPALLSAPLLRAQPSPRLARIGVLAGAGDTIFRETFTRGLRDLGWIEGENLEIDWRSTPKQEEVPALAADIVRLKPRAVVTAGPRTTQAVASLTRSIPIVFIAIGDPVKLGVVESLTHPGGNVTGFQTVPNPAFAGKLIQMLKEAAPRTSRVGLLVTPANAMHSNFAEQGKGASKSLGMGAVVLTVRDEKDFEAAFELAKREGVDGLATPGDILFSANRERIAALALRHRLPTVFMFSYYADAGGMLAYAVSVESFYRNAARQVDKILRGARPQDMPVEQAETYDFVINLKTAKQLGLRIPHSLLLQATRVIE
jgi:putative tryptophan/tyrosine transport system substrate-binding protein